MSSTIPISSARSTTLSPPPTSTTSRPPRQCRSKPARPMFSTSAITTSASLASQLAQRRLVTRFKTNTPLNSPRDLPLPPGSALLGDRTGFLPARQAMNHRNPMQDAVREIVVRTETGETLRLMTNDLETRPGDRRSLPAPLADRVVLPSDETDAEDHEIRWKIGKRRAHPDRRRPHRLSSHARPATDHERRSWLPRARSNSCAPISCIEKISHGSANRRLPRRPTRPAPTPLELNLNRTAVA